MTLKDAIKAALAAHDAGQRAIEKMRAAGAAFVALEERGAKTEVARALVEQRGVELKTAKNYVSACIKVYNDPTIDTVRAARSVSPSAEKKGKRFNKVAVAQGTIDKHGEERARAIALAILARLGD
jgi:hypothetical protein